MIKFLNYNLENDTKLKSYFMMWLKLNLSKPPKTYIPKPSSKLKDNEIVIRVPENYQYWFLSFTNQKLLEKIVTDSFFVIAFEMLFTKHFNEKQNISISQIIEKYNLNIDFEDTIKKRFYRLKNG